LPYSCELIITELNVDQGRKNREKSFNVKRNKGRTGTYKSVLNL
jgi:hypothetical protein